MTFTCHNCLRTFRRSTSRKRPAKFCNFDCYNAWRKGRQPKGGFAHGSEPWNKGMKGIHLSPETEFKRGRKPNNHYPVGTTRIRKDKNGTDRNFTKIAEPNKWEPTARVVWEQHNHQLKFDEVIHHIDGDSLNDDIANLCKVTRAQHLKIHRKEFDNKRKRRASRATKERWREYRRLIKRFGRCECGQPAVVHMKIKIGSPNGFLRNAIQRLCESCYSLEVEMETAL